MAVIITDMNIPERCGVCRFTSALNCSVNGKFIKDHSVRAEHCPLKSVDEMIDEIKEVDPVLPSVAKQVKEEILSIIDKYIGE